MNPYENVAFQFLNENGAFYRFGLFGISNGAESLSTSSIGSSGYGNNPPPILPSVLTPIPKNSSLEEPKKSINGTQKNIIETIFIFYFEQITELPPRDAITAFKSITTETIPDSDIEQFKKQDIWECIEQARNIIFHPCPQNRSIDYPYFCPPLDSTMVVYKNTDGKPALEKKGVLNLTVHNDKDTSITKEAVVDYVQVLINAEIVKQEKKERAIRQIQFWYRRTRDENKALSLIENKEASLLAKSIMSRRAK